MSTPTSSQQNAQDLRSFVPTVHKGVYSAIDPRTNKLPQPFTVVILGGSGAVGSGMARAYAMAGITGIVVAARRLAVVEEVTQQVKEINPSLKTLALNCDVSSASDVAAVADATRTQFGGHTVGAVIVNAGFSGDFENDITKESVKDYETAFGVNTLGTAYAGHYFIPLLKESIHKARVFIGICSMSAATINGPIAHIHYCASKFAQTRVIEMISEQHEKDGIFAVSLHPGGIKSDLSRNAPEWLLPCEYLKPLLHTV